MLLSPNKRISPLLNAPDGLWNFGEAPAGSTPALGGTLTTRTRSEIESELTLANLVTLKDWDVKAGSSGKLLNYIGRFRRSNPGSNPDETEAAFEIVVPVHFAHNNHLPIVLVIGAQQTTGSYRSTNAPFDPHIYPGQDFTAPYWGLQGDGGQPFPYADAIVGRYVDAGISSKPFRVVAAYAVPRTGLRPLNFAVERMREVRAAVMLELHDHFGTDTGGLAVLIGGGSFGCFTTQVALMMHPDEFHAGAALAYNASHRGLLNDFDRNVLVTSLLGLTASANAYSLRDSIDFTMYCEREQTDFTSLSFVNRLLHGHVQRPFYIFAGDEDTVTHGNEWVNLLAGQTGAPYPYSGTKQWPSISGPVEVYWTIQGRVCHADLGGDRFTIPGDATPLTHEDQLDIAWFMLDKAHAERLSGRNAIPVGSAGGPARKVTTHPNLASLDPYDLGLLDRKAVRAPTGGTSSVLSQSTTFQSFGSGTWAGNSESLKVYRVGDEGGTRASIFVGSAEGVITRYAMTPRQVGATTIQPLVVKARSNQNGTAYSLGFGVWALDVGTLETSGTPVVVAAAYRRLAIFDAVTLNLQSVVDLPDWEFDDPRKLQIVDALNGQPVSGKQIVFRTLHGHIAFYDRTLTKVAEIEENSVVDFVFVPGVAPTVSNSLLKSPLFALSARGHVLRIELDANTPRQQFITAASALQYGLAWDLEVVPGAGTPQVIAMYSVAPETALRSLRVFSASDLSLLSEFASIDHPFHIDPATGDGSFLDPAPSPNADAEGGLAILPTSAEYVTLCDYGLGIVEPAFEYSCYKHLKTFGPALNPTAVQVGQIDDATPELEIVVSTNTGRVVYFDQATLRTPGPDLGMPHAPVYVAGPPAELLVDHANASVGSTWAFTLGRNNQLLGIDQSGSWWYVHPDTGAPALFADLKTSGFRGIVDAGTGGAQLAPGTGQTSPVNKWRFGTIGGTGLSGLQYGPYAYYSPPPPSTGKIWDVVPPWLDSWSTLMIDGYWLVPKGGALRIDGNNTRLAWWSHTEYPNLIHCFRYDTTASPASGISISATSGPDLSGARPGRAAPNIYFRTEYDGVTALFDCQTLKLGRFLGPGNAVKVVASSLGGVVTLVNSDTGVKICESDDFGYGGLAMAVADLDADPTTDEIVFSPLHDQVNHVSQPARPTLRVLRVVASGSGQAFAPVASLPLSGPQDIAPSCVCGLAVADFGTGTARKVYIVVTTLNGELLVYEWNPASAQFGSLVHSQILEGSLGAYNSILIQDLSTTNGAKPELYIAGSRGIRRWDFL